MKIILSRKGFDSQYGRVPSPIFPNGRMYSIPIPYEIASQHTLADLRTHVDLPDSEPAKVAADLTRGKLAPTTRVHLDPDLDHAAAPRTPGWRPAFGQVEAAQGHLRNNGVGVGDIFLFFGWFREVERSKSGRWTRRRSTPDLHVLFGWLQVGQVIDIESAGAAVLKAQFPGLATHPHLNVPAESPWSGNTLYLAADRLTLPGETSPTTHPGAGLFRTFVPNLALTAPDAASRSNWRLPRWFAAADNRPPLSYHAEPSRWTHNADHCLLRCVDKGQEFVLDCTNRPEAAAWLADLIDRA